LAKLNIKPLESKSAIFNGNIDRDNKNSEEGTMSNDEDPDVSQDAAEQELNNEVRPVSPVSIDHYETILKPASTKPLLSPLSSGKRDY